MSLENNLLDKIPKNIKRFRYENGLFVVKKSGTNDADFYVKNIENRTHMHFFENNKKVGMVLTREDRRGKEDEHRRIDPKQFLITLKDLFLSAWGLLERVETDDSTLAGKQVILCSVPRISFDGIRDRMAYFKHEIVVEEGNFEDIDTYQPRIGVIKNKRGQETDLLFIRNGEIYRWKLCELKKVEKKFKNEHKELD